MIKRPSFQFYPADWRKDMSLQSCSIAARGLWIDMMCIAHECEPYGHLTVNGKPMTAAQIGRHVGLTERECVRLLDELDQSGVLSRTEEGTIFSRRMVRDEDVRNRRASGGSAGKEFGSMGAEHGKKGGRPLNGRGVIEPPIDPPIKPPPSSSSSSSSSNTPPTPIGGVSHFEEFWSAYPKRVGKGAAEKAWQKARINGHAADVIAAVERQKQSEQWIKDGGQFIPNPATWLNQRRWEDELPGIGQAGGSSLLSGVL